MSFKSFVADQFHESSVKLLFINTKLLAKEILNDDELDEAKGIARKGSQAKQKGTRWVFINQLIETRIDADNQIGVLRRCTSKVYQAIELELGEEDLENFLKLFSVRLAEDIENLEGLREALKRRRRQWEDVLENISRKKLRVLVSHAIFGLNDISGIEIGSVVIGGLMGLGIVYMWFFYQGAAGLFVHKYWTLDDLVIQGISIAWLAILVLFLFEATFQILLKLFERVMASEHDRTADEKLSSEELARKNRAMAMTLNVSSNIFMYVLTVFFRTVFKHPIWLVLTFIAALLVSSSGVGYLNGRQAFDQFREAAETPGTELETATVTEGTILSDVLMVGATSRSAIFLQLGSDDESNNFNAPPEYKDIWKQILLLLPIRVPESINPSGPEEQERPTGDSEAPSTASEKNMYQVLVMDRAQIICHTKGQRCKDLMIEKEKRKRQY